MKKIYQIIFALLALFFIIGQENLVFGQNEIIKMLEGKIATCGVVINESINKTDTTYQTAKDANQTTSIRIRCGSVSPVTTHKPLYVIDGVPQENDSIFNKISPEHIEAITVLKSEGATALYGCRGANGVVLITLKKKEIKEEVKKEKLEKPVEEIAINIFPNPTSEFVNIALHLKEKSEIEINIYNLQTLESYEVVKEEYEAGKQTIKYQTDFLKRGIYSIKIKIGNQIIERKLVIEK